MYPAILFLIVTDETSVRVLTISLLPSKSLLNAWGYLLINSMDTLLM